MPHHLGDFVSTNGGLYTGRVHKVHLACPESNAWLAGQQLLGDNPMQYRLGRWVSVLVHGGGAVVVPDLDEFVQTIGSFVLENKWADIYFGDTVSS